MTENENQIIEPEIVAEPTGETKKCDKCKKDIDKTAKLCPHCKTKQMPAAVGCIILIVLVLVLGSCMSMCSDGKPQLVDIKASKETQFKQAEKLYMSAYIISRQFIKEKLKSPGSAKFQPITDLSVAWWKGNEFMCTVKVDSQNSFGAMIRSVFVTRVKYTGDDKWLLLEINQVK